MTIRPAVDPYQCASSCGLYSLGYQEEIAMKNLHIMLAGLTAASLLAGSALAQTRTVELSPGPGADKAVKHGAALAEANCATCHSIGIDGPSIHPDAPPFWEMSQRRPVDTIAEMLLTKTSPAHPDMPTFEITPKQAFDLASWIAWVQPVAHGKRLVEENCASCHAVGQTDASAHDEAPPFRILSEFYPIEALEEAFAESIESGHPDMPVFNADMLQLQDILAYVESIQQN